MIKVVRGCTRNHHLKPDFLLLFKYIYEIGGLGLLGKRRDKDLKLKCQPSIDKRELVEYVIDITAYFVPHYGLHVLGRRLTTLRIVK